MARQDFTAEWLKGLPYETGGQKFYWDTSPGANGLGLRVGKKKKTFIVQKRALDGKEKRETLGEYPIMKLADARKKALSHITAISTAKTAPKKEKPILSLNMVFQEFKKTKALKDRTVKDYERCFNLHLSEWLDRPWNTIKPFEVQQAHKRLSEENGLGAANLTMRVLRSVLTWAKAIYRANDGSALLPELPTDILKDTKQWNKLKPRKDHIPESKMKEWLNAVENLDNQFSPCIKDYLVLTLLTGLRRNESEKLEWENINFQEKTLTVYGTKNGKDHTLPIPPYLFRRLEKMKESSTSKWVFPSDLSKSGHITEPKKAYARIDRETGLHVTIHGLRRTFSTFAESVGLLPYVIKKLMNHTSGDVTESYLQISVDRLRQPMADIENAILIAAGIRFVTYQNDLTND